MQKFTQEKYEIRPQDEVEEHSWSSVEDARSNAFQHRPSTASRRRPLRPETFLADQNLADAKNFPYSGAGETDVTELEVKAFKTGFTRGEMESTDGEGNSPFYGEAVGQDDSDEEYSAFLERGNVLDRN